MKWSTLALASSSIALVNGAAISQNSKNAVTDKEVLDSLLNDPYLLSKNSRALLQHRVNSVQKRQSLDGISLAYTLVTLVGGYLPSWRSTPKSLVPDVQQEAPKHQPDAKRVKIRYGPFRIPPTTERNFQSEFMNVQGMSTSFTPSARKPCEDCTLLNAEADLEYADGKPAANSNGAWFHHAVLLNSGPDVLEANCGKSRVENIMMSGNERTTGGWSLPNSTVKSGYALKKDHSFLLNTELMNMDDKEKWVWMTLTFEYLEGLRPDFKNGKTIWMAIGAPPFCGGDTNPWGPSNLTKAQQPKSRVFSEHSQPWTVPMDGVLLATGGHLHDGGTGLDIYYGSKVVCSSKPDYQHTNGTGHGMGGAGMKRRQLSGGEKSNTDIDHIAKQDGCLIPEGMPLSKGEKMYIQANYDFEAHPGMKNKKGELDEVMGISGSLVAF